MKKLALFFTTCLCFSLSAFAVDYDIYGVNVSSPTPEQIALFYQTYNINETTKDTYFEAPYATTPYVAGSLSDATLTNSINTLNYIRYIAGLSYDVTLNESYNELAQHSSLVNAANYSLTHTFSALKYVR